MLAYIYYSPRIKIKKKNLISDNGFKVAFKSGWIQGGNSYCFQFVYIVLFNITLDSYVKDRWGNALQYKIWLLICAPWYIFLHWFTWSCGHVPNQIDTERKETKQNKSKQNGLWVHSFFPLVLLTCVLLWLSFVFYSWVLFVFVHFEFRLLQFIL